MPSVTDVVVELATHVACDLTRDDGTAFESTLAEVGDPTLRRRIADAASDWCTAERTSAIQVAYALGVTQATHAVGGNGLWLAAALKALGDDECCAAAPPRRAWLG
jgi:hypothetical protein